PYTTLFRSRTLWQPIIRIVCWKISASRPCDAEHDARIDRLNRVLYRRQHPVRECDVVSEVLFGIGAGNFAVVLIHQLIEPDLAALDADFERLGNAPGGVDDDLDQRCVRRFDATARDQFDQPLGGFEKSCDPLIGVGQIGRRQIDALCEIAQFLNYHVAVGEIRSGGLGDFIDLAADRVEAVLHADDNALDLLRAIPGTFGAKRGIAALADQVADLAIEIAPRIADQL